MPSTFQDAFDWAFGMLRGNLWNLWLGAGYFVVIIYHIWQGWKKKSFLNLWNLRSLFFVELVLELQVSLFHKLHLEMDYAEIVMYCSTFQGAFGWASGMLRENLWNLWLGAGYFVVIIYHIWQGWNKKS